MPEMLSLFLFHVALWLLLMLLYLYLDICTNYLLSVESRLHMYTSLHPNSCLSKI